MSEDPSFRNEKGQFVPGCPGGPGRKPRRDEYLAAFQAAITPDKLTELALKIYGWAEGGDKDAYTCVCRYLLPAPSRTEDGDPLGYVAMITAEQHALMRAQLKEELRREMQAERIQAQDPRMQANVEQEKLDVLARQWAETERPKILR